MHPKWLAGYVFHQVAANETEQIINLNKGIYFAKLKVIYLIPPPLIDAVGEVAVQATSNCGDSAWTSDMANVIVRC